MAKKMDKAVRNLTKEVKKLRKQNEKLAETIGKTREDQAWAHGEILSILEERLTAQANVLGATVDHTPDTEQEEKPEITEAAQRRATDLGVDLSDVKGTGSGGRVLVKDVETAADGGQ